MSATHRVVDTTQAGSRRRNPTARDSNAVSVSAFRPGARDGAARAVSGWSAIVNAASTAAAMAAARVAECGPPPSAGARDAADWLAKKTGTSSARAKQRIRTGETLRRKERTRQAATAGK